MLCDAFIISSARCMMWSNICSSQSLASKMRHSQYVFPIFLLRSSKSNYVAMLYALISVFMLLYVNLHLITYL
jgi:hypothetical protein